MKTLEQLRRLQNNKFYKMTNEEKQALSMAEVDGSSPKEEPQRKTMAPVVKSKDNAAVKETGKLNKHSSDPVTE